MEQEIEDPILKQLNSQDSDPILAKLNASVQKKSPNETTTITNEEVSTPNSSTVATPSTSNGVSPTNTLSVQILPKPQVSQKSFVERTFEDYKLQKGTPLAAGNIVGSQTPETPTIIQKNYEVVGKSKDKPAYQKEIGNKFQKGLVGGIAANQQAREDAQLIATNDKKKIIDFYENQFKNPDLVIEKGLGEQTGQLIGGVTEDIILGAGASLAGTPVAGIATVATKQGAQGAGAEFRRVYLQSRKEGKSKDEAYDIATNSSIVGGLTNTIEGALGAMTGLGGKAVSKVISEPIKKAVAKTLVDSGIDATVAGGMQIVRNLYDKWQGLQTQWSEGVPENVAAEFIMGASTNAISELNDLSSTKPKESKTEIPQETIEPAQQLKDIDSKIKSLYNEPDLTPERLAELHAEEKSLKKAKEDVYKNYVADIDTQLQTNQTAIDKYNQVLKSVDPNSEAAAKAKENITKLDEQNNKLIQEKTSKLNQLKDAVQIRSAEKMDGSAQTGTTSEGSEPQGMGTSLEGKEVNTQSQEKVNGEDSNIGRQEISESQPNTNQETTEGGQGGANSNTSIEPNITEDNSKDIEKRKPIKVYHATNQEFEGLPTPQEKGKTGTIGLEPMGTFYSTNPDQAKQATGQGKEQRIVEAEFKPENPLEIEDISDKVYQESLNEARKVVAAKNDLPENYDFESDENGLGLDNEVSKEFANNLKEKGYDSVIINSTGDVIVLDQKAVKEPSKSAIKVESTPLSELSTDKKRFQNREEDYSQQSVDSIKEAVKNGTFDINELDPIRVWTDTKDGKKYILAGHSRTEAFRQLQKEGFDSLSKEAKDNLAKQGIKSFDNIPSIDVSSKSESDAIAFAKERSNTSATKESDIAGANLWRSKREKGESEAKIREALKGRANLTRVELLSYLNPKGKTIDAQRATENIGTESNTSRIKQIAEFIGHARKKFPQLTNSHENEMFDYLMEGDGKKITQRNDFIDRIDNVVGKFIFDAKEPLNLNNVTSKGSNQIEAENIHKELLNEKAELEKERSGKGKSLPSESRINEIDKQIKVLNTKIAEAFQNIQKAKQGDKAQLDIFGQKVEQNADDLIAKLDKLTEKDSREVKNNGGYLLSHPFKVISEMVRTPFKLMNLPEKTLSKFWNKVEDAVAVKINQGLQSQNKAANISARVLKDIMLGSVYTESDANAKASFTGLKNFANLKAKLFLLENYKLIDNDLQALENVHSVLDPEFIAKKYEQPELGVEKKLPTKYEELNDKEKKLYDILRTANDFIHDFSFKNGLIDQDTYEKYKGKYIARIYEDFIMDAMPEEMQTLLKKTGADLNIYKERKDLNEVNAEALADPIYATAKRLAQIIQNQAVFDYARSVNNSKAYKVYSEGQEIPDGYRQLKASKPIYGILTNKYVPGHIADDFQGFHFANEIIDGVYNGLKGYDKLQIRQFLKKKNTIYNPVTQLGNFLSQMSFSFSAGVDPYTFFKQYALPMKETDADYQLLVKNGILGSSIIANDTQPLIAKKEAQGSKFTKWADKVDKKLTDIYGATDDRGKLAIYRSLVNDYKMDSKQALRIVKESTQNYSGVGKLYDVAAKTPIIGNQYIKFSADLARIIKNGLTRRPLTTMAYLGVLYATKELLSNLSGEDEDVKKVRERRAFIPKIKLGFTDIPLVFQVPGVGEVNMARFLSPYYIYDKGAKNDMVNDITKWLPFQLELTEGTTANNQNITPVVQDVLLAPLVQVAMDKDFRGKSIRDPAGNKFSSKASTEEKILNSLIYLSRSYLPMFGNMHDLMEVSQGKKDYYNREKDLKQAILSNFIKVQEFGTKEAKETLEKEVDYAFSAIKKEKSDISSIKSEFKKIKKDINERKIPVQQKERLIQQEHDKKLKRISEKLNNIVEIQKSIVEPEILYKKIINKKP